MQRVAEQMSGRSLDLLGVKWGLDEGAGAERGGIAFFWIRLGQPKRYPASRPGCPCVALQGPRIADLDAGQGKPWQNAPAGLE